MVGTSAIALETVTLKVGGLFDELDHLGVEKHLRRAEGVVRAEANPGSGSVTIDYDANLTDPGELARQINACGYHCLGRPVPLHLCGPE